MIRLITFVTAVALAAHVAPAHAAASGAPSMNVEYRDLDLSVPEGRARLNTRISAAARQVCPAGDIRDLRMLMAAKACYRAAIASAQPQLAAIAARKTRASA